MAQDARTELLSALLETLVGESDPSLRERLILEAVLTADCVGAAAVWRATPGWRLVQARSRRGPLPPELVMHQALLSGAAPAGADFVAWVAGPEACRLGLVLGDLAWARGVAPGEPLARRADLELLEALFVTFAIIEASIPPVDRWSAPLPNRGAEVTPHAGPAEHAEHAGDPQSPLGAAADREHLGSPPAGRANEVRRLRHDLRNALASLASTQELLQRLGAELTGPEAAHFQAVVEAECRRVGRLIGETAGLRAPAAPESVPDVIRTVVEAERSATERARVALVFDLADLPDATHSALLGADWARVVQNLLVNAREALAGRARGRIRVRLGPGPAGGLELVVEDNGPGLPPIDPTVLWGEGVTHGKPAGGPNPTRGSGLAIVADLVRRAGGEVSARTRPEGGAAFEVVVPRRQP